VTTIIPRGRGPFVTWEEGARDALEYDGLDQVDEWSPARACFEIEKFNGFGYRNRGVPSPYLWSFTNHYSRGKYVADGRFSAAAVDKQCGAIPVMRRIMEITGATFGDDTRAPKPTEPAPRKSLWALILELLALIFGLVRKPVPAPAPNPYAGDPAPHLAVMRKITGTKEAPGDADNPAILAWPKAIGERFPDMAQYCRGYKHDSIPWCGLTVGYALAAAGLRPVFGRRDVDRFLWAAAWGEQGPELVKLDRPLPGAIMVFTRNGGGHVALYEGEDATHYHIRGGNQSDMVNVVRKPKSQFTAATWPRALPIPKDARPVRMDAIHNPVVGRED